MRLPHLSHRAAILAALALAVTTGACTSIDDVEGQPVRLTQRQAVPWELMANCIARRSAQEWAATPTFDRDRSTATIVIASKATPDIMAIYTVRADGTGSVVEWRRRKLVADLGGLDAGAKGIVDRCAAGG